MNDSDLQHAHNWDRKKDLTGWLLTEKMDGCRAFWDGEGFWTRAGLFIDAPERITDMMENRRVDGEMWAGRGDFQRASNAVRHGGIWWEGVNFVAFDVPDIYDRWIRRLDYAAPALHVGTIAKVCESNAHALRLMREIQSLGGEGLVARKPDLMWRSGRTLDMLKIK